MLRTAHTPVLVVTLVAGFVVGTSQLTLAQETGTITGTVVDKKTDEPMEAANVVLLGTRLGAMVLEDGRFTIVHVPVGTYTVRVTMMGYAPASVENVVVNADQITTLGFALEETIAGVTNVIEVFAPRPLVKVKDPNVVHGMDEKEFENQPVENIRDVPEIFPGVIKIDDEYMVQGGRPGEAKTLIDGVPVDDPLGTGVMNVGRMGAAGIEMTAGGMSAEYGNAQSAIFEVSTREGGDAFGGEFRYMTDDFGRADKTYTNYDNLSIGFGGPTPIRRLRYYISTEATFADGENNSIEPRTEYKSGLFDWLKARERMSHAFNLQSKLSYQTAELKLTGEVIAQRSRLEEYHHNWNVQGYVQKVYYFQRLIPTGTGKDVYGFGGISVQYEGPWLARVGDPNQGPNPRPVTVEKTVGDPETGETSLVTYTNFRAIDVGDGTTILWDEITANGASKPWILFEGFQYPYSQFSTSADDTSYVFFNSASRTPEVNAKNVQLKLALYHNLSDDLLYSVRLSRLAFNVTRNVGGKAPGEYASAGLPVTMPDGTVQEGGVSQAAWYTDAAHPYLVTAYDYPLYSDRQTVQYVLRSDVTSKTVRNHQMQAGILIIYNDLLNDERLFPAQRRLVGTEFQQGLNVNRFHNFNTEGALYVQDKWEYEGLVVNAGLRFEYMTVGNRNVIEIHNSEINPNVDTYKHLLSPRLGIAFPISDRNKFFFNYGRYTQWASAPYLFASQDAIASVMTLGNPNLGPELTVAYQAGISHQFTDDMAANFVVFNKDIYGLVSSTRVTDDTTGLASLRYINKSYASARGLEVSLEKRLTRRFGFQAYYTYAFADGVASDADFGRSAEGLTHLPTDELPLDWDQRHTFNITLTLQDMNSWGATAVYRYGSGLPWTPYDRAERLQDPKLENTVRYPATHRLSLLARKHFNIYGRELTLFVEGRNLLDQDIIRRGGNAPTVTPALVAAQMDNGAYLTETGRYGGAYVMDRDSDGVDEFFPVNDPTIWEPHRFWRLGFGFQF